MSVMLPVAGARRSHRPHLQDVLCWSDISIFDVLYFLDFSIMKAFNEKLK